MARGKIFILVAGIIMAIQGLISLIVTLIPVVSGSITLGAGVAADAAGEKGGSALITAGTAVLLACIIPLIVSFVEFSFGVSGIRLCGKPRRFRKIFRIGVFLIVLQLIGLALNLFANAYIPAKDQHTSVTSLLISAGIGMILPIFYIIGAQLNKKSIGS